MLKDYLEDGRQHNGGHNRRKLTYNGKTQSITDWAIELNIKSNTILARLSRNWSIEKTLSTKVGIFHTSNEINNFLTKDFLYENYFINKKSLRVISKETKISIQVIQTKIKEYNIKKPKTHGLSNHKLYRRWYGMLTRCYNKKNNVFKYYGGRGIKVCDEWYNNFEPFYNWSVENGWKEELEIDRIDTNGHYEPNNCRWITHSENCKNKRKFERINQRKHIMYNGKNQSIQDWAKELNLKPQAIQKRLWRGWSIKDALHTKRVF